jgi:hypothetical protein
LTAQSESLEDRGLTDTAFGIFGTAGVSVVF